MEGGVKWKIRGRKDTERNGEGRVGKERREVKGRGREEGREGEERSEKG